ncbi:MAG TPA: ferredoxin reductase [Verrucomicrobiae bacterium]|nr:ferredoxin reductase [Verrucomicrobiae bacterium]
MLSRLSFAAQTLASPPVLEFWAGQINKSWSFERSLARVVARHDASADAVTLILRPNRKWRGFEPGQHVNLTVEVDGRRLTRSYSPSKAEGRRGCIEITVKNVPGGSVSTHVCRRINVGDVVELGQAYGEMRVADPEGRAVTGPRLFLAAGSGITPLMAMTRELAARGMPEPVTLYYWCRTRAETCFASELRALAQRFTNFQVHFMLTREAALCDDEREGRIGTVMPAARTADRVFACGPSGFVASARELLAAKVHSFVAESFSPPAIEPGDTGTVRITLARSGRTLEVARGKPLLVALEEHGETPAYGCRMGICNTCACPKSSGATKHLRTGDIDVEPISALRLCVNGASSDLVIEL